MIAHVQCACAHILIFLLRFYPSVHLQSGRQKQLLFWEVNELVYMMTLPLFSKNVKIFKNFQYIHLQTMIEWRSFFREKLNTALFQLKSECWDERHSWVQMQWIFVDIFATTFLINAQGSNSLLLHHHFSLRLLLHLTYFSKKIDSTSNQNEGWNKVTNLLWFWNFCGKRSRLTFDSRNLDWKNFDSE